MNWTESLLSTEMAYVKPNVFTHHRPKYIDICQKVSWTPISGLEELQDQDCRQETIQKAEVSMLTA